MTAFNNAWNFLKALPEQQMFVERTRRQSLDGSEDEDFAQDHLPEIDRYGARSMGTVHPAILGMLQRRTDDYHQTKGISPDLNLDSGKEDDRRMHPEVTRYQPEQMERAGMSIAQGPDYNRRLHDYNKYNESPGIKHEDAYHNPDMPAKDGPFDPRRYNR